MRVLPPGTSTTLTLLFSVLCLLVLFFVPKSEAQTLDLKDMVLDSEGGNIRIRFGLAFSHVDELVQELEEGAVLELTCKASLERRRFVMWDKTIAEETFVNHVQSMPLSKQYVVFHPEKEGDNKMSGKDLSKLLNGAWKQINMDLGPWRNLERGREYVIILEVEMERVDVPSWIRTSLFFWSWEVVPDSVYELDFSY